jgi:hypothetical protein
MKFKINKSIPKMLLRNLSVYNFSSLRAIRGFTHRTRRAELCKKSKKGLPDRSNPFDGYGCLRKSAQHILIQRVVLPILVTFNCGLEGQSTLGY